MPTEITIAIIAALGSFLVALLALFSSRATNRHALRQAKAIEELKVNLLQPIANQANLAEHKKANLKCLGDAIRAIQVVKDAVQL